MQELQSVKRVPLGEAQRALSAVVGSVRYGRARVLITSHGHPACAVVSIEDLKQLEDAELAPAIAPQEESEP